MRRLWAIWWLWLGLCGLLGGADFARDFARFDREFGAASYENKLKLHHQIKNIYIGSMVYDDVTTRKAALTRLIISADKLGLDSSAYKKELKSLGGTGGANKGGAGFASAAGNSGSASGAGSASAAGNSATASKTNKTTKQARVNSAPNTAQSQKAAPSTAKQGAKTAQQTKFDDKTTKQARVNADKIQQTKFDEKSASNKTDNASKADSASKTSKSNKSDKPLYILSSVKTPSGIKLQFSRDDISAPSEHTYTDKGTTHHIYGFASTVADRPASYELSGASIKLVQYNPRDARLVISSTKALHPSYQIKDNLMIFDIQQTKFDDKSTKQARVNADKIQQTKFDDKSTKQARVNTDKIQQTKFDEKSASNKTDNASKADNTNKASKSNKSDKPLYILSSVKTPSGIKLQFSRDDISAPSEHTYTDKGTTHHIYGFASTVADRPASYELSGATIKLVQYNPRDARLVISSTKALHPSYQIKDNLMIFDIQQTKFDNKSASGTGKSGAKSASAAGNSATASKSSKTTKQARVNAKQNTAKQNTTQSQKAAPNTTKQGTKTAQQTKFSKPQAPYQKTKLITIDAGHGGKDGGASEGQRLEKTITLQIALKLQKELKKRGYKVYLTRSSDKFISLRSRTKLANDKMSDLFISIHANSVPPAKKQSAYGIETYFLSPARSERSKNAAAMENKSDIGEMDYFSKQTFLNFLNREKIISSNKLAIDLQSGMLSNLRKHYKGVKDGGVREAPFWVLVGALMPAVLVEVGYITHPTEGARIATSAYQDALVVGLANGIEAYFAKNH